MVQGLGKPPPVHVAVQAADEPPEGLGQDHAGVPPGPHQRGPGDGRPHRPQVAVAETLQLLVDCLLRPEHVRAGVAVGHRVDVQRVDLVAVLLEGLAEPGHRVAKGGRVEGGHAQSVPAHGDGATTPGGRHSMSRCDGSPCSWSRWRSP